MFDFFDDIFSESKSNSYRFQVNCGNQICLEGYKELAFVSDEKIVVRLALGKLEIYGKNLCIKELGSNTIVVSGILHDINLGGKSDDK